MALPLVMSLKACMRYRATPKQRRRRRPGERVAPAVLSEVQRCRRRPGERVAPAVLSEVPGGCTLSLAQLFSYKCISRVYAQDIDHNLYQYDDDFPNKRVHPFKSIDYINLYLERTFIQIYIVS
jgi:hypothetical protein